MPSSQSFRLRRGTAAAWTSANPVLAQGEPGYVTDTGELRIGDGTTAWSALVPAAGPTAYVNRTARTQHAVSLGLYFPEAEGAVGNGTTDDRAALLAALNAAVAVSGQVILKPGTTYGLAATLAIPANARIIGNSATLKLTTSAARVASIGSNTRVEDVTFDGNNLATSYTIEPLANADGVTLTRCRLTSSGGTGTTGFRTQDGVKNVTLDRCTFDNLNNCVKLDKNPDTVRIVDCYFTSWEDRAIWAVSSAGFASKNVWIERCMIQPHRVRLSGGVPDMTQVRQPIAFQGVDTDLHRNVHILDNIVIGPGYSYNNTTNPGAADLISVHRTNGLQVIGNTTEYGGDVGITVAQQCQNIVVANNVTRFNDSTGICIGSAGSTSLTDGTVIGNTSMNNGQNRTPGGVPTWAQNGINLNIATRILVTGNRCGDDQGTKTQQYGITVQNTTDVTVTANHVTGNNTSGYHKEGTAHTRLGFDTPAVRATKTADQTVNNSVALVNVTDLTIAVAAEGIYAVEAYLNTNATTTADMSLKWAVPAGATMDWTSDGPHSTTANGIQRTAFTAGSTATIGGVGSNAVATPVGTLTVGSTAGNCQLQFAQGVAEVSDAIIRAGSWIQLTRIG